MKTTSYIVILQQVITNTSYGFEICYDSDLEKFSTPEKAIAHGFKIRESDDFNLGVLEEDKLVEVKWMETVLDYDAEELKNISKYLGL